MNRHITTVPVKMAIWAMMLGWLAFSYAMYIGAFDIDIIKW